MKTKTLTLTLTVFAETDDEARDIGEVMIEMHEEHVLHASIDVEEGPDNE